MGGKGPSSDRGPDKSRSKCHRIYSTNYHRPVSSKALVQRNWSLCRNTIVGVAPEEADVFPGRILAFVNMVTVSWSINVSLLQIPPLLSEEQWRAHSQSLLSTAWHLKMYAESASCTYGRGRVHTKLVYVLFCFFAKYWILVWLQCLLNVKMTCTNKTLYTINLSNSTDLYLIYELPRKAKKVHSLIILLFGCLYTRSSANQALMMLQYTTSQTAFHFFR